MNKTALIIGATGLVGEQCLKELLASPAYDRVVALTRSPLQESSSKLENIIIDFDRLDQYAGKIKADDIYCAIGTTIDKAGSQAAFRKVDYEIPLRVAELALQNGAKKFILVSALSANAQSSVFYSRTKGELEEALKKLSYPSLIIFRPSVLVGKRKENRTGEKIGIAMVSLFSFLLVGSLRNYRATPADLLAKKMVRAGVAENKGVVIIENKQIIETEE